VGDAEVQDHRHRARRFRKAGSDVYSKKSFFFSQFFQHPPAPFEWAYLEKKDVVQAKLFHQHV
jgi:hypothetical protein